MKKTIVVSIPMKPDVQKVVYKETSKSIPSSKRSFRFPVNAFLDVTLSKEDEIKFILLVKKDGNEFEKRNVEFFEEEFNEINEKIGAVVEYTIVDSDFSEIQTVHEEVLFGIVDATEIGSTIYADITYGPKDLPVLIFTALNYMEKFMECTVEKILYGQAVFKENKIAESFLCDMSSLYCLGSVSNLIRSTDPEKAKKMLKSLLFL